MDAILSVADRIGIGRELLASAELDLSAALAFLNTLPPTLRPETAEVVDFARTALIAVPGGNHRHLAVARYTLARVLVALEGEERRVVEALQGDDDGRDGPDPQTAGPPSRSE